MSNELLKISLRSLTCILNLCRWDMVWLLGLFFSRFKALKLVNWFFFYFILVWSSKEIPFYVCIPAWLRVFVCARATLTTISIIWCRVLYGNESLLIQPKNRCSISKSRNHNIHSLFNSIFDRDMGMSANKKKRETQID